MLDTKKIKTDWNLALLLPNDSDIEINAQIDAVSKKCLSFITKWKDRDDYLLNPVILKEALGDYEKLQSLGGALGNVGYYISLKGALYQDDPQVKAKSNKIEEITLQLAADLEFFTHKISRVTRQAQTKMLSAPELFEYRHLLELLFQQGKYLLTEPEEKILTLYSPLSYGNWVRMTSEFISTEERKVLVGGTKKEIKNFPDLTNLLSDSDVKVRESAAGAIDDIFEKHIKVGEAELNTVLMNQKLGDKLRGFTRPDAARHLEDDIDSPTVDMLLDVVKSNYEIVHRYYNLKAKLLKLPKIRYFERNILYKGLDKTFTFDQAAQLVYGAFLKIDLQFAKVFESFLYSGQIDVFTKKGKNSSEFCAGGAKSQPGYVLLNYTGKIEDVSTIAHEMGHAINDELVKANQNALMTEISLCLAETASTFFEDFILEELSETLDEQGKLALSIFRLDSAVNTVFRQVACYRFEQDLHNSFREKSFLSKDDIGELFVKNMLEYCGPSVEMTRNTKNWWLAWPHIRSYFYVYTYAFGFLVSKNLQKLVRSDKSNVEKVKTFLSAGSSKRPVEILCDIGVDIDDREFWLQGIREIEVELKIAEKSAERLF